MTKMMMMSLVFLLCLILAEYVACHMGWCMHDWKRLIMGK
ncbi:hypothetical protein GLYMA_02G214851v4 [Glycine max]|nr:hypothetical protein GLYMA_02G214851v4 [Glycine max]KAH1061465.1 hypothetical protein GYH30_004784 [Glycine max]